MPEVRFFEKPVIIVGAPRSGTSLLQKIIREHPGFVSVPRESDVIWFPYTFPSQNEWRQEGILRPLAAEDMEHILNDYNSKALSAGMWSHWSKSGIMNNPIASKFVRLTYPTADKALSILRRQLPQRVRAPRRLVDKSVHFAFWLSALEQVFPDALYIHITRNPESCINSMINGWQDPERFNTYLIPESLKLGIAYKYWSFPMPPNWKTYAKMPLQERVANQWVEIQNTIIGGLTRPKRENRYLRIKLEELSSNTKYCLSNIARFIEIQWSDYFENLSNTLPVVNSATYANSVKGIDVRANNIKTIVNKSQKELGY